MFNLEWVPTLQTERAWTSAVEVGEVEAMEGTAMRKEGRKSV